MRECLSGKILGRSEGSKIKIKRTEIFKSVKGRAYLTLLFPLIKYVWCVCVTFSLSYDSFEY